MRGKIIAALALAVSVVTCKAAGELDGLKVSLAPEFYYWYEDIHGNAFDIESGFRIALEFSYKEPVESGWLWADRLKFYGGSVLYNGGLQGGPHVIAFKTTTEYYGALVEARYGYRWQAGSDYYVDAMPGITLDFWDRHLNPNNGISGQDEYWFPVTLKLGVDLSPKTTGFIASFGAKCSVFTYERSHQSFGSTSLYPQPMISGYAELGYQFTKHLSLTGFFDSYWFRRSNTETIPFLGGAEIVHQPESISYQLGVKAGWTF